MGFFDSLFGRKSKPVPSPVPPPSQVNDALFGKVALPSGLELPKILADNWGEIESTKLVSVAITGTPAKEPGIRASHFGYFPCIPKGFEYPKDVNGGYMYPLAQLHLTDAPNLQGYPESGYLQFYIALDDAYGLDFENAQSQKTFRVLYFTDDEVKDNETDFYFLRDTMATDKTPLDQTYSLSFELAEEFLGMGDVRSHNAPGFIIDKLVEQHPDFEEEIQEAAYDNFSSTGHKMGGYCFFTQNDPRIDDPAIEDYICLFQMDSIGDIMWGDCGVANFMIHPDDLARKDFSKVYYNWDCS